MPVSKFSFKRFFDYDKDPEIEESSFDLGIFEERSRKIQRIIEEENEEDSLQDILDLWNFPEPEVIDLTADTEDDEPKISKIRSCPSDQMMAANRTIVRESDYLIKLWGYGDPWDYSDEEDNEDDARDRASNYER